MATARSGPVRSGRSDRFDAPVLRAELPRVDDLLALGQTPTGVRAIVEIVEAARRPAVLEHQRLAQQAAGIIPVWIGSGSAEERAAARAELVVIRDRLTAVRRRLQRMHRRVKQTFAAAHRALDGDLRAAWGSEIAAARKGATPAARVGYALGLAERALGGEGTTSLRFAPQAGGADHSARLAAVAPEGAVAEIIARAMRNGTRALDEADLAALLAAPAAAVRHDA